VKINNCENDFLLRANISGSKNIVESQKMLVEQAFLMDEEYEG